MTHAAYQASIELLVEDGALTITKNADPLPWHTACTVDGVVCDGAGLTLQEAIENSLEALSAALTAAEAAAEAAAAAAAADLIAVADAEADLALPDPP
jgi:hypothetical protein